MDLNTATKFVALVIVALVALAALGLSGYLVAIDKPIPPFLYAVDFTAVTSSMTVLGIHVGAVGNGKNGNGNGNGNGGSNGAGTAH